MSHNRNEDRIRAFISEVWNSPEGRDRAPDFLDPSYRDHAYGGGVSHLQDAIAELRAAFSNAWFTIDDLVGNEDRVAVRMTMTARHDGAFRGHAATDRAVEVKVYRWYRLREERIVEHWALFDTTALLRQLSETQSQA